MSGLRRQGAWAVIDQVLSSGTNFVPALVLARVLGPADYGTFSIVFLAWFGALEVLRSALMRPYTIAASAQDSRTRQTTTARASGAVVLGGVVCGLVFAVVGLALGVSSGLGRAFLVIALLAPGLALQEFWRVASFSASQARTAAANDMCWAVGQIVAFGLLLTRGDVTVGTALFAWGAGAWLAAGLGIWQLSVVPRFDRSAARWAKESGRLGAWFTLESSAYSVGYFCVALIIAAQSGSAAVGLMRAVQNLFGPVQLLTIGAASVYLPHLVRVIKERGANGLRDSRRFSVVMTGVTAVYGLVVLAVAPELLRWVFGESFAPAKVLVLPLLMAFVLDGAGSGALLLLSARAMGSRLLLATLVGTIVRVGTVALLGAVTGLRGAVWGLAVGSAVTALALWTQVALSASRERGYRDVRNRRTTPIGGL